MAGGVISTDGSRIDHHDLFSSKISRRGIATQRISQSFRTLSVEPREQVGSHQSVIINQFHAWNRARWNAETPTAVDLTGRGLRWDDD